MNIKTEFEFGTKVRDKISGAEGMVTGYASYVTGCLQVMVTPRVKAATDEPKSMWLDEGRLEVVEVKKAPAVRKGDSRGCMTPAPTK